MKRCPKCRKNKREISFDRCASRYDGLSGWCKKCKSVDRRKSKIQLATRKSYNTIREISGARFDAELRKRYGITLEKYTAMLSSQNNSCFICKGQESSLRKNGKPYRLAVDHCHKTGKVRALLCFKCNAALGAANDSIVILNGMISYLRHFA